MSSVNISLTVDNTALKASLAGIVALHASGYAQVKNQVGTYMVQEIKRRFDTGKLWNGQAMKQSKAAIKRGGNTLLDKGNLMHTYNFAVSGKGVELFGGKEYAAIHHFGGAFKAWGKHTAMMTARPVLGVSDDNLKNIGSLLVQAITASVARRGI
jgi:phage virion morphogenesis protein